VDDFASIEDRRQMRVFDRRIFEDKTDFLCLFPEDLPDPFLTIISPKVSEYRLINREK